MVGKDEKWCCDRCTEMNQIVQSDLIKITRKEGYWYTAHQHSNNSAVRVGRDSSAQPVSTPWTLGGKVCTWGHYLDLEVTLTELVMGRGAQSHPEINMTHRVRTSQLVNKRVPDLRLLLGVRVHANSSDNELARSNERNKTSDVVLVCMRDQDNVDSLNFLLGHILKQSAS